MFLVKWQKFVIPSALLSLPVKLAVSVNLG